MLTKRVEVFVKSFQKKWFPTDDDRVWKRWVDYKRRELRDLIGLLNSDVRDSFKRRVVFLLLVPTEELNPIYWTEEVGKFYQKIDFLKTLNPGLLSYATDLIVEFYAMLKPMHCDSPSHYSQGQRGGVILHFSVTDKYHEALSFYNDCILLLLTLLPEEQCEKIFPLFSLRDISTYNDLENFSGYRPFRNLLRSKVDEKWKKRADATMRQIVKDELAGRTKPRENWENALQQYAKAIDIRDLNYSVDLYADQIQFLVSEEHYDYELIDDWMVGQIFQILPANTYRKIRHQVAKFIVFGNSGNFKDWLNINLEYAKMMLNEFGQDDNDLAQRIQSAINEGDKQFAECQNEQTKIKKAEDDIISQMK